MPSGLKSMAILGFFFKSTILAYINPWGQLIRIETPEKTTHSYCYLIFFKEVKNTQHKKMLLFIIQYWESAHLQIEWWNKIFISHHWKYCLEMDSWLKKKTWNYTTIRTNMRWIFHSIEFCKELNDPKATNVQWKTAQNKPKPATQTKKLPHITNHSAVKRYHGLKENFCKPFIWEGPSGKGWKNLID